MNDLTNPVEVLGIDAGGTMTDTFFVRADGTFVVGKAQSDVDEANAVLTSSVDALAHWDVTPEEVFPQMVMHLKTVSTLTPTVMMSLWRTSMTLAVLPSVLTPKAVW